MERVDLIAYHEYGKVKYEQLGREYKLGKDSISEERINEIKSVFEGRGLKIYLFNNINTQLSYCFSVYKKS